MEYDDYYDDRGVHPPRGAVGMLRQHPRRLRGRGRGRVEGHARGLSRQEAAHVDISPRVQQRRHQDNARRTPLLLPQRRDGEGGQGQ